MAITDVSPHAMDPAAGRRQLAPLFACLLAAALFGASSPSSKALLSSLSPLTLAGLL